MGNIANDLMHAAVAAPITGLASLVSAGGNSYDVVGIDYNKITSMDLAIQGYVLALQRHLNGVKTNTSNSNAMKGEYAVATQKFVEAVVDACAEVISLLDGFRQRLAEVKEAYVKRDSDIAKNVTDASKNVSADVDGNGPIAGLAGTVARAAVNVAPGAAPGAVPGAATTAGTVARAAVNVAPGAATTAGTVASAVNVEK